MSGEKLKASLESSLEDAPPGYNLAIGGEPSIPDLFPTQANPDNNNGFEKTMTRASYQRVMKYFSACTRCQTPINPTSYHYSCPKGLYNVFCVCQKCQDRVPSCQMHRKPLIKRTMKPWLALPPMFNSISHIPTKIDNPLIHALKSQDDDLTTFHARDSSLLDAHTYLGYTPLHFAAHLGLVSGASILLARGALTNSRDDFNQSPLLIAIEHKQPQIVSLLLQNNANIHSVNGRHDTTALHAAATNGFPELVSLLLEKGTTIDRPSGRGTALQLASRVDSFACASILLENGENPNAKSEGIFGAPSIISAVRNDNAELLDLLVKYGANVSTTYELTQNEKMEPLSPLLEAVEFGCHDIARKLLAYGADVNWCSQRNVTCLSKAAELGKTDMCRILIENGAEIDWENKLGMNAVLYAAVLGREEMLEALFEMGASGKPPKLCAGKWKRINKFFRGNVSEETRSRILKRLRAAKHV